jgi:purine-binding chemotaxis protein CheW
MGFMSDSAQQLVVFVLGRQRFAVPLAHVIRVVAAAQWTPVPGAPEIILGVIDFHGEVIPVVDPRLRLQPSAPAVSTADQFIIARTRLRTIALLVNDTLGVIVRAVAAISPLGLIEPGGEQFAGATTLDDGLVLIHDIEQFLSAEESRALEEALNGALDERLEVSR